MILLPLCLLFGLRHPSTGVCRLLGRAGLDAKMTASSIAHTSEYSPCPLPPLSLFPQPTPTSPGEDPRLAVSSGPSSYGVTALPQVPVYVYSKSGISVSPIIMEILHWSPTGLQAKCSRDLSICKTPRLGTLNLASELSLLWEKLCDIITFQFVGCPPGRYEIWLYHTHSPTPVSLWLLLSFNSVAQLCLALCDPMDCSKPGFPVHHFFILFMGFWRQEY